MENQPGEEEEESGGGPSPAELITFLRGAPKRHRMAARIAFGSAVSIGLVVAVVKPPTYTAEVKILAMRDNKVNETARNITRTESPTKGAAELIQSRDNLVGIIEDLRMIDRWEGERTPLQRVMDGVLSKVRAKPTEEDKIRAIVGVLEKKVAVSSDDMTVTITAQWANAKTAYEIASDAEKRFVNGRQTSDVSAIQDGIKIIESALQIERNKLNDAVKALQDIEGGKHPAAPSPTPEDEPPALASASASPSASPKPEKRVVLRQQRQAPPAPDRERVKALAERRARLTEVKADRQRQVDELGSQVASLRSTLTPAHPSIVALERRIEVAKQPSAEELSLEQQVHTMEADLSTDPSNPYGPDTATGVPSVESRERDAGGGGNGQGAIVVVQSAQDDAQTSLAKQRLTNATLEVDALQGKLRTAQIDLDVAEAAFKYRYTVVVPPEIPRDPKKPSPGMIAILGVVVGFLLYVVVPAALDFLSGRFIAGWQAKKLGIPLLGELDPPV